MVVIRFFVERLGFFARIGGYGGRIAHSRSTRDHAPTRVRMTAVEGGGCNFFHGQIDLSDSFPAEPVRGTREAKDIDWDARANVLLDFSLGANLQSQSIFETLAFLRNRTFIGGDQCSLSELRYRTALLSQSKVSRIFVRLTRGFESPLLFAIYGAAILLSAALIYTTTLCGFVHNSHIVLQNGGYQVHSDVSWGLPLPEAFYFSCITFTTIGYGDLAPLGITRFFAASEGLLRLAVASSRTRRCWRNIRGNSPSWAVRLCGSELVT